MNIVVPAVIPRSDEHLIASLEQITQFTEAVQVDIVDGSFVPDRLWPYDSADNQATLVPYVEALAVEIDLMVKEPELTLALWTSLDVARIVIHLESVKDMERVIALMEKSTAQFGLSISNDTPLSELDPYFDKIDFVQLMGIAEIGRQGQGFDERVLDRITTLHTTYPDLEISIDGSVNLDTLSRLRAAGASRFVSGSAILSQPDPGRAYQALVHA